jgi:hypothetical protein
MDETAAVDPNRRKPTPEFTWEDLSTALLPVLACFLGGATEKWAEGIVVAVLGLLLVLNPPRFSAGWLFRGIAVAFMACAALAFLPASWFMQPTWRQALVNDFGMALPNTVSPQPWISSGCLLSLFAGLCWLTYVVSGDVEVRAARRQFRIFAGGVILLAALAIVLYLANAVLPFWHNQRRFGPFPNRNQTASLFGITSVIIVACAHEEIRRRRKGWIFWLLGLAVIVAAVVLNFSRAGIGLVIAGIGAWVAVLALRSASKKGIAIGLSIVLVLLTAMLLFGGETLERFHLRGAAGATVANDFRWLIFRDALALIKASPWCGIGLGNFSPVFALFRDSSAGQTRALHPESDWLWLWSELGWPGVALVVAGGLVLFWRAFPFVEGSNQWFRTAALIAVVLFGLHGLIDVSGHRVGSAYAGLFLLGMAVRRPIATVASVWLTRAFRVFGFALIVIGLTWVVTVYRQIPLPGSVGVDVEKHLANAANVGRNFDETIARASQGLTWAPLDWELYFLRALGEVGAKRPPAEAVDDFRRARFLEPMSFEVPYQEGVAWMTRDRLLALTAWREALRRAGPQRSELYSRMLSSANTLNPAFAHALEEFGGSRPDLTFTSLERANGETFRTTLHHLVDDEAGFQSLTAEQRARVFELWTERGELADLASYVDAHPDVLELAWRGVAKYRASLKDFRGAYNLTKRFGARPALPQVTGEMSIDQLQKAFVANPTDYQAGFALYHQQMEAKKVDDALNTVRRFTTRPGAPPYFHFLEAEGWEAKGNYERAWQAWSAYDAAKAN